MKNELLPLLAILDDRRDKRELVYVARNGKSSLFPSLAILDDRRDKRELVYVARNGKSSLFPSLAILDDRTYGSHSVSRSKNATYLVTFLLVGGQGFEPWKADANRFTVCPV